MIYRRLEEKMVDVIAAFWMCVWQSTINLFIAEASLSRLQRSFWHMCPSMMSWRSCSYCGFGCPNSRVLPSSTTTIWLRGSRPMPRRWTLMPLWERASWIRLVFEQQVVHPEGMYPRRHLVFLLLLSPNKHRSECCCRHMVMFCLCRLTSGFVIGFKSDRFSAASF